MTTVSTTMKVYRKIPVYPVFIRDLELRRKLGAKKIALAAEAPICEEGDGQNLQYAYTSEDQKKHWLRVLARAQKKLLDRNQIA